MKKMSSTKDGVLFFVLLAIFIFVRIFSDSQYYFIQATDAARYLALAKNFPHHASFNNQLYLMQPPLYPYTIGILSFLFEDHIAAILVSLISSVITFIIIYKLAKLLSNNRYVVLSTLILFSLSELYITISTEVMRESLAVMLTLASLYNYMLFLKFNKIKNAAYSSLFAIFLGLTTDSAIFLIPSLFATYVIFKGCSVFQKDARAPKKILLVSIPIISAILSYSFWIGVRFYTYTNNVYYPAAVDGTIVKTDEFSWRALLSPHYFKEEAEVFSTFGLSLEPSHYLSHITYMLNLRIFPFIKGLKFSDLLTFPSLKHVLFIILYLPLSVGAIYGAYKILSSRFGRRFRENGMLLSFILFIVFLFPLTQIMVSYRYTITSVVFLFMIVSYGFFMMAKKLNILKLYHHIITIIIFILIIYLPFYYVAHPHFLLYKNRVVESTKTAKFLQQLPKDGVMAKVGYSPELNYLTNKRVMAWPINIGYMFLIDKYNISYIVYGDFYGGTFIDSDKKIDEEVSRSIENNPNKFRLLKIITEDYPIINNTDKIRVYEVIR